MPLYRIGQHSSKTRSKELLLDNVSAASSFTKKLFGLIFEPKLDENTCFLIENCNSIHTMWMRYHLDVIFLSEQGNIVRIFEKMPPFRVTPFIKKAKKVIELYPGFVRFKKIKEQDILEIK